MFLTVHVRKANVQDLIRTVPRLQTTKELCGVLSELGIKLEPMHPGTSDSELATQFYTSVPDEHIAGEVARRLRESKAVEATYFKSGEAPPG